MYSSLQALTGAEYPYVQFGKPSEATYKFAETMLKGRLLELRSNQKSSSAAVDDLPPM